MSQFTEGGGGWEKAQTIVGNDLEFFQYFQDLSVSVICWVPIHIPSGIQQHWALVLTWFECFCWCSWLLSHSVYLQHRPISQPHLWSQFPWRPHLMDTLKMVHGTTCSEWLKEFSKKISQFANAVNAVSRSLLYDKIIEMCIVMHLTFMYDDGRLGLDRIFTKTLCRTKTNKTKWSFSNPQNRSTSILGFKYLLCHD